MPTRLTVKRVHEALVEGRGYVTDAARLLGVTSRTIHNWVAANPELAEALEDIRESRHDHVENKLMALIDNGDTAATIFYAKTQLRKRGYQERHEISGADGTPLEIVIKRSGE